MLFDFLYIITHNKTVAARRRGGPKDFAFAKFKRRVGSPTLYDDEDDVVVHELLLYFMLFFIIYQHPPHGCMVFVANNNIVVTRLKCKIINVRNTTNVII